MILAVDTRRCIDALTGLPPICPDGRDTWFPQLFAARLPACDLDALKARLYDEHRIEAPLIRWNSQRLSVSRSRRTTTRLTPTPWCTRWPAFCRK